MLVGLEIMLLLTPLFWAMCRGWLIFSNFGSGRSVEPWEKAGCDILTVFIFGSGTLALYWTRLLTFAGHSLALWIGALSPAALYFYLAFRFAGWRWRRRADHGKPLGISLKPQSAASWVIYAWFLAWVVWQVCHAFAPSLLPGWLS